MESSIIQFREILTELKKIKEEEQLYKLDDNILFDGAVRIYNSILIGQQRSVTRKEAPMTLKQKQLLEDLEYKGRMDLTKSEATDLIGKFLDKQKQLSE